MKQKKNKLILQHICTLESVELTNVWDNNFTCRMSYFGELALS